jgi:hypothetical protein
MFRTTTQEGSAMIDWNSPTWGQDGTNTHKADNGSWVPDRHGDVS